LTLSTIKEIFEGNKEIFKGLWIYNANYDWKKYPIVRVDFSAIKTFGKEDLIKGILSYLNQTAREYNIELEEENYDQKFRELILKLSKIEKIVILIDEYDKPDYRPFNQTRTCY
ncbi:MAG: AAA family ATPase, partial [Leptospiraceae bacterium]|nr:AAA family ATPase [Leptospiraceae bacterium]